MRIELPKTRISGRALAAVLTLMKSAPARRGLTALLRADLGIDSLRALPFALRGALPATLVPLRARTEHGRPSRGLPPPEPPAWVVTARRLQRAYADGTTTVEEVVRRSLAGARDLEAQRRPVLSAHCDAAALEAAAAFRGTEPQGGLGGVPLVIKEELDVAGLPTRLGTRYLPHQPAAADCVAVARLRAAGAVVVGQTVMTEHGLSPLGDNVHRDMPRNVYQQGRLPGGSSTGTGVAVAAGMVPVGLGTDGGGSVRIPAALNGVFGLKPTFGRIPRQAPSLSSVVHIGPLGASVEDLARFVEAAAGPHPSDPCSEVTPAPTPGALLGALGRGVTGLRIGVLESEWRDAAPDVQARCREALAALEREGATLVSVELELVREAAAIGYLTIGLETLTSLQEARVQHFDEFGPGLALLIAGLGAFRPDDYLDAQLLRTTLRQRLAALLAEVDVLALPTTRTTAPPVSDREAREGFTDPAALADACRYAFLGNLTGVPCGTAPVGLDRDGLPVGLQIVGDAWDEAAVLQVLAELERIGVAARTPPPVRVSLLG